MAAGKNYLKTNLFNYGIPAAIYLYAKADGTGLSIAPDNVDRFWQMTLPVFVDGSGHFIYTPLDPGSITGLAALCA